MQGMSAKASPSPRWAMYCSTVATPRRPNQFMIPEIWSDAKSRMRNGSKNFAFSRNGPRISFSEKLKSPSLAERSKRVQLRISRREPLGRQRDP